MGMYSNFDFEDIEVKDLDGLNKFLKKWNEDNPESYINKGEYIMLDGDDFSFNTWDDIKLISYWYDDTCNFLKGVAQYIEGQVYWLFENPDETAWVEFKNGICIIHTGVMEYCENSPDDFIRHHKEFLEQLHKGN